jgi:PsbP
MIRALQIVAVPGLLAVVAQGCGSVGHSASQPRGGSAPGGSSTPSGAGSAAGANVLSAESRSAATGDIPDNQVFLTYRDAAGGYSISYPEGWTRKGSGTDVTFSDKNNIVHIVIDKARAPSTTAVTAELTRLKQRNPTLTFAAPTTIHVKAGRAIKATYATRSAPNPVTGKSVQLIVDRYELAGVGKRATVDLGTPKGVDNVDAYRMMINSLRWQ